MRGATISARPVRRLPGQQQPGGALAFTMVSLTRPLGLERIPGGDRRGGRGTFEWSERSRPRGAEPHYDR